MIDTIHIFPFLQKTLISFHFGIYFTFFVLEFAVFP